MQRVTVVGIVSLTIGLLGGFYLREVVNGPGSWWPSSITVAGEEWTRLGENGRSTVYLLPIPPTQVPAWVLYDYKEEQELKPIGRTYRSQRAQIEIDCALRRVRTAHFTLHQGQMGRGEVVHTERETSKWEPIAPSTNSAAMASLACKSQ